MLVFNTEIDNYRFPLANWLVFFVTIAISFWAWNQPEVFWENLQRQTLWGPYYLVISTFLHADLAHLFWNMYFLLVFGNSIAGGLSPLHYLLLYLSCAIFADVISNIFLAEFGIGASGAVYGIMGFFLVAFWKVNLKLWIPPFPVLFPSPVLYLFCFMSGLMFFLCGHRLWRKENKKSIIGRIWAVFFLALVRACV